MKISAKQTVINTYELLQLSAEDMRVLEIVLGDFYDAHNGEFTPLHEIAMKAKSIQRAIGYELRERNDK